MIFPRRFFRLTIQGFFLLVFLSRGFAADADPYWVFFADRGDMDITAGVAAKIASPTEPKNLSRRARVMGSGALFDERDLPVYAPYIEAVAAIAPVRTITRYFNGVSVETDETAIPAIRELPFVREIRSVNAFRGTPEPPPTDTPVPSEKSARTEQYDYGNSFDQVNLITVNSLHALGHYGEGIRIAVLDSGFEGLEHAAFDSTRIEESWDFVGADGDLSGDDHGTEVLAIMSALDPGNMIGTAPYATYFLARTEIVQNNQELRAEEDYWVAATEWADSLGADIISSSLGYTTFDDAPGYTYADLNGDTAITTIAADIAASRGIVVVTSAGNEGDTPWHFVSTPSDADSIISVGAVDRNRVIAEFSSRGPTADGRVKPEVMALGKLVWTVNPAGTTGYRYVNGTSFAAPLVGGAAALLLEANPNWGAMMVRSQLIDTASDLGIAGPDSLYGYGLADVFAASGLEPVEPPVSAFRVYDPFPQPVTIDAFSNRVYFPMDVPEEGRKLTIRIYNFGGELVQEMESPVIGSGQLRNPGEAPSWDGTNFTGEDVAPGVYIYTIRLYGYETFTGKLMVMR